MTRILSVSESPGWWAVRRLDRHPDRQRRHPVAAWAVLESAPLLRTEVVGLVSSGSHLALADEGCDYRHADTFPACTCPSPLVEAADPRWCERCAGTVSDREG